MPGRLSIAAFSPPPGLPPLGGGAGFPPPAGEGQRGGYHRARGAATQAGRPRFQAMCSGRCAPRAWGLTLGKPGFPHTPARGRVWEGQALRQESGETRFPRLRIWREM